MASFKSSPYSSSSVPISRWTYDVFLSFRGEDTRNSFVDHLYTALIQRGIHVFKDEKALHKGKPISRELLKAIEESRYAVVVFSENYANSSWCLDELVKIMECQDRMGQMVLPVFHHVDPSDVRGQKRDFGTAFQHHEDKFSGEIDRVNKWRNALAVAANLSGWHVSKTRNGGEAAIISKIVEEILDGIQPLSTEKNLIGIESRIDELSSLLGMEVTQEVRMVGVLGMGGIGKTTITKALFRRIAHNFEGSSFIEDVRANASSKKDICALQEQILKDILVTHSTCFLRAPEVGANMIQRRFCNKKVLLVLDDVDNDEQLEFLAGTHEWFGPGSRIIITTRDEHLLSNANAKYKPDFLLMNEAIELFCMHAFGKSSPPEGYEELSHRAICYASCLPLALKVLGTFLHGRQVSVWESALNRLGKTSSDKILETLKLSFDGLDDSEKQIFLDIACFFKGKDEEHVTRVLDSFGFDPVIGISVLIEKSLITISNKKLDMHDLIQEMGYQIVRESFPNSRIWQHEQIHDLFNGNKNLEAIEAIMLMDSEYHVDDYDAKLGVSAHVFESMKNLRLLDISKKFTSTEPKFLPNELRWLCWNHYPFLFLPIIDTCKLVGLEMAKGHITHLWNGRKIVPNLKFIHLERMHMLTSLPDVSGAPHIERLILSDCRGLVEVHESLGSHQGLVYLDMNGCRCLKRLPWRIEMGSLETLILSGCKRLESFPQVSPCMVKLSEINLFDCSEIKELPSSIRYLSSLSFLKLTDCKNLRSIPNSICELKYLKCLHLHNCDELKKLPKMLGRMKGLQELSLGFSDEVGSMKKLEEMRVRSIHDIWDLVRPHKSIGFHSFTSLSSLKTLNLSWRQIEEESFPKNLDAFSSLEELYLSGNSKIVHLPASICQLSRLKRLELNDCIRLQSLCVLPSSIQVLKANDCISLKKIRNLTKEGEWLYKIWLIHCHKILEDEESHRYLIELLQKYFVEKCAAVNHRLSIAIPGSKIPSWFKEEKHVFHGEWRSGTTSPRIIFSIVSDGKVNPKSEVDCTKHATETTETNGNVWICYIPLGYFQQMYRDLQPEDWCHIEGNLHMTVMLTNGKHSVRCGAHAIYKENVRQITTNCISDYGNVVHVDVDNYNKDLRYDETIAGHTYVYEEKSDDKSLMPLRSRTSQRCNTENIYASFKTIYAI